MSSVGKSFIALSNGTGDLAHGLSFSSRKRVCSPSLSRSLDSISQPLALSALDSEASEAASWSSVASILVGFELGQGVGRTLGARRWCACACLRAGAGVRAPGGGAGDRACGSARACRCSADGLGRSLAPPGARQTAAAGLFAGGRSRQAQSRPRARSVEKGGDGTRESEFGPRWCCGTAPRPRLPRWASRH